MKKVSLLIPLMSSCFVIMVGCKNSKSDSHSGVNIPNPLPVVEYNSDQCLDEAEIVGLGINAADIEVRSGCIHRDSTEELLMIETKAGSWVQILYSNDIMYQKLAEGISEWACHYKKTLVNRVRDEFFSWEHLGSGVKNKLKFYGGDECIINNLKYSKEISVALMEAAFHQTFYLNTDLQWMNAYSIEGPDFTPDVKVSFSKPGKFEYV